MASAGSTNFRKGACSASLPKPDSSTLKTYKNGLAVNRNNSFNSSISSLAAKTVLPSSRNFRAFSASSNNAVFSLFPRASFCKRGIALSID
jgi:hypothetical protein